MEKKEGEMGRHKIFFSPSGWASVSGGSYLGYVPYRLPRTMGCRNSRCIMAAADRAWRDLSRAVGLSQVEYNGLRCPVSVPCRTSRSKVARRWKRRRHASVALCHR